MSSTALDVGRLGQMTTGRPSTQGPTRARSLPVDASDRKRFPVASGVLDYFPDAVVAVAGVSYLGNEQHNPGEPLHWARGKSMDQDDALLRHFLERGKIDNDGVLHSAKMAWRALALLQLELESMKQEVFTCPNCGKKEPITPGGLHTCSGKR